MIIRNQLAFRILRQSLFLAVLAFFCFSVSAQQTNYFQKPAALSQCNENDEIQKRILYEYGAVYLSKGAKLPTKCRFESETEIAEFTSQFKTEKNKFGFGEFYLQSQAKASLEKIFDELGGYKFLARNCNSNPKDCKNGINNDWALRTYKQTEINWINNKECNGKASDLDFIQTITIDPIFDSNLKYEQQKCNRPKIFRVAMPGSSQHHLGLAIDVNNGTGNSDIKDCQKSSNCRVCRRLCIEKLKKYGWFRTVIYDPYHFTFLGEGLEENDLRSKGLKEVKCKDGKKYWVPNIENYEGYKNWRCENV